jgi:hypothetical protein
MVLKEGKQPSGRGELPPGSARTRRKCRRGAVSPDSTRHGPVLQRQE